MPADLGVRHRDGREERARVRVLRLGVEVVPRSDLHGVTEVHDHDAVGDVAHDVQVVGDEDVRQPERALEVLEQVEDLRLDRDVERLVQIRGQPPSLLNPPRGCRFHPRCPYVMNVCKTVEPELLPAGDERDHVQACHLDVATKDREAAKVLAGTMAEAS